MPKLYGKKNYRLTFVCIDEDWSVERAENVLEEELAKDWNEVDDFLLEKAFATTTNKRQLEMKELGGIVSEICKKFPLLQKIDYVRICKYNEILCCVIQLIQFRFVSLKFL